MRAAAQFADRPLLADLVRSALATPGATSEQHLFESSRSSGGGL
jgi:hypothetical protein